jgi:hypothetical protein
MRNIEVISGKCNILEIYINILKSSGSIRTTCFNILKLRFLPTQYICLSRMFSV